MRSLSSAYHQGVIRRLVETARPRNLKNLVFSSREMCHAFDIFMRTVKVLYCRGFHCGRLLFFEDCVDVEMESVDADFYYWIASFIRNLELRNGIYQSDFAFFEQIYHCNSLSSLKLFARVSHTTKVVRKLISITRRLIILDSNLSKIDNLLHIFEAVSITKSFAETEVFMNDIKMDSTKVLEIICKDCPFGQSTSFLSRFKQKFQHVSTLYFAWPQYMYPISHVEGILSRTLDFFSNVKNPNVFLTCYSMGTFQGLKNYHNGLVAYLRALPDDIKLRLILFTHLPRHGDVPEDLSAAASRVFPAEEFVITPEHPPRLNVDVKIVCRQKQVKPNIEFTSEYRTITVGAFAMMPSDDEIWN